MKQFWLHINNMIANTNNIWAYCNLFIPFRASILLFKPHSDFILAIKTVVIANNDLDYCGATDNS